MKTRSALSFAAAFAAPLALAHSASATLTFTQTTAPAPTYSNTLNFDEPGGPTGLLPSNSWASLGITITDGVNFNAVEIGDYSGTYPWVNSGNAAAANFGLFLTFSQDITALSFQAWDPSGPPGPFGGGFFVYVTDDTGNIIDGGGFTGAWGGIGDTWYNVTASAGTSFHNVVILNNGFDPVSYVDNLSWNVVPGPSCLALLGVAGALGRKRHRI